MTTIQQSEAKLRSELNERMRLPMVSTVTYPIPKTDQLQVEDLVNPGSNPIQIRQPYYGLNSWIRVMPDPGTQLLVQRRGDSYVRTVSAYLSDDSSNSLAEGRTGALLYRELRAGEIEIMSSGRSYLLVGDDGDIELRGGSNRLELLQSEMEIHSIAPTHKRCTHLYKSGSIGYEERFGVVKRPDQTNPIVFQKFARLDTTEFAVEYSRWLNDKDGKLLASTQEGHVFDTQGKEKKHSSTNKPLRYERVFSHKSSGEITIQIDNEANILLNNNTQAKETKITLGSLNALTLTCDSTKWNVSKTGLLNFNTSLVVKSAKIQLNAPNVGCGAAPIIPAVLGTPLAGTLTALVSGLQAFAQVYGADPIIVQLSPQTVVAANVLSGVLAAAASSISNILSTQVKFTG